mgnify:CR=1 FL=1
MRGLLHGAPLFFRFGDQPLEYLTRGYLSHRRWNSFWYQIEQVLKTKARTVLEVGVGSGVVAWVLRRLGLSVTTVDVDPETRPDVVGDVRELHTVFGRRQFDCVLCAQVLEHLPFDDFERALAAIKAVTRRYLILTLPIRQAFWGGEGQLWLPLFGRIKARFLIRRRRRHAKPARGHLWEIGLPGYPLRRVLMAVRRHFKIEEKFSPPENRYHLFLRCVKAT